MGRRRPDAGDELQQAEAGDAVTRVLREAQHREDVLDVRRIEEFQSSELDEWDVATRQFDFQRTRMMRSAEEHGLLFQGRSFLTLLPAPFRKHSWPAPSSSRTVTSSGFSEESRSVQRFLVKRSLDSSITALAAARIVSVER